MSKYLAPGVFVEAVPSTSNPVLAASASTGGFVGITVRGDVGVPTLVTSWQSFLNKFALGVESPFIANSDLAYAVYGFFQNGGTRAYVVRVAGETAEKSKITAVGAVFSAKDEGTWGNNLKVGVKANALEPALFDVTIKLSGEIVELFEAVSNDVASTSYFVDVITTGSGYVIAESGSLTVSTDDEIFSGGVDGIVDIADEDYLDVLETFNTVDEVTLISVPGQTSGAMLVGLTAFAETRPYTFAILDSPKSADVTAMIDLRKTLSSQYSAIYYPWIKVIDPVSKTGKLRDCPPSGHIMGVYARTIANRGEWKAPAGTESTVRGAVQTLVKLSEGDISTLNPLSINAIVARPNAGIVVWGARNLSPDASSRYVSDSILDIYIRKTIYDSTQWAVFEPHNAHLWTRVISTVESFLDSLWRDGGLFGEEAEQAYFVRCDEELNPASVRDQGKLICEVGYARNKPAEFVIFRVSHDLASN